MNLFFSTFTSTLSTEFYLICDQTRLSDTATSISFIGFFLGAFFGGMLADKFGRKKTMIVSLALTAISLYAQAFIPGYVSFLVFRVAVMAFNHMAYLSYCCYVCEIVGQGEFVLSNATHLYFRKMLHLRGLVSTVTQNIDGC